MKTFGVRLAAGAVTILLGALAAAQAQRDRGDRDDSSWNLAASTNLSQPPVPITGIDTRSVEVQDASTEPSVRFAGGPLSGNEHAASIGMQPTQDYGSVAQVQYTTEMEDSAAVQGSALMGDSSAEELPQSDFAAPPNQSFGASADGPSFSAPPSLQAFSGAGAAGLSGADDPSAVDGPSNVDGPAGFELPVSQEPAGAAAAVMPSPNSFPASFATDSISEVDLSTGELPGWGLPDENADSRSLPSPEHNEGDTPVADAFAAPTGSYQPSNLLRDSGPSVSQTTPSQMMEPMEPESPTIYQQPMQQPLQQPMQQPMMQQQIVDTQQPTMTGYAAEPPRIDTPIAALPVSAEPRRALASPGDRRLEGIQTPSIVIQKRAPSEVKVGKAAAFVVHVQNVGSAEALDVHVHDQVPNGMRLIDAEPKPQQLNGVLVWSLGSMPAGDERTITMQLVPEQEGELGSVARVTFEAAASVRTVSTRPELKVVQKAPLEVLIGQQLEIEVEVSNPGTGAATGVIVQADVPEGLEHPKGRELDNLLGVLAPGEVQRQVLRLRAVAPGLIQNQVRLVADDGLTAQHTVEVEVISPELQIALQGPSRRFLERQATYQLQIANVGTADATNVEIAVQLDRGFTFISTDYEGQYDRAQHAVVWSLENLPKGGSGQVPLTLLPVEEGARKIMMQAKADLGATASGEFDVAVETLAQLTFQITDSADPIEVGGETTYEIRLTNTGSRDDTNVRVQLQLPTGIELVAADSNAQEDGRGSVFFAPKTQLAVNSDIVYRVRARGAAAGTHLIKAVVTSDQSNVPVTKEESTMVYADR